MFCLTKVVILTCAALWNQPPTISTAPVDFYKEEITLEVSDSTASVHGVYYFRNNTNSDRPFPIIFPFYVDSVTSFPGEISAYIVNGTDTTLVNHTALMERGAIRMLIPMKPKGVTVWNLDYTQTIKSPHARYILTSTAAWKKPLEEATYYFVLPASYDIIDVWPEPDDTEIADDRKILKSERKNFMPNRDMELIWERK